MKKIGALLVCERCNFVWSCALAVTYESPTFMDCELHIPVDDTIHFRDDGCRQADGRVESHKALRGIGHFVVRHPEVRMRGDARRPVYKEPVVRPRVLCGRVRLMLDAPPARAFRISLVREYVDPREERLAALMRQRPGEVGGGDGLRPSVDRLLRRRRRR